MGCDEIQGPEASIVHPRRGAAGPDGQWETDLPGKCWKLAAFPLEWRLHLSLGMTPKAVLGEWVSSRGAGEGLAGGELAQQICVHTVCADTSFPCEGGARLTPNNIPAEPRLRRRPSPRLRHNGGGRWALSFMGAPDRAAPRQMEETPPSKGEDKRYTRKTRVTQKGTLSHLNASYTSFLYEVVGRWGLYAHCFFIRLIAEGKQFRTVRRHLITLGEGKGSWGLSSLGLWEFHVHHPKVCLCCAGGFALKATLASGSRATRPLPYLPVRT